MKRKTILPATIKLKQMLKFLSGSEILEFEIQTQISMLIPNFTKGKKHLQAKKYGVGYIYKWTMFSKTYTDILLPGNSWKNHIS